MPVPASDAIASDVGHGALGVRYGLRPFRDLLSETSGQRHLWVELRPKLLLASWTAEGGGLYSKAVAQTFDSVVLDVVGVQTLSETLTRVESSALCTAGKFYYSGAMLYIHLTADANPSGTSVVAELGVHVGSHGVYQPVLGRERLTNGTFEAWTGSAPDGWTANNNTVGGSATTDKTTDDPLKGAYAWRVTLSSLNGYRGLYQVFTGSSIVPGAMYRFSGAYRINAADGTTRAEALVSNDAGSYLYPDGVTTGNPTGIFFEDLSNLNEWRRFAFDFVVPATWTSVNAEVRAYASAGVGTVDFDDVKLQCISRFAFYEPLLSLDSLPTTEVARSDSFWGEQSSALGSLSLLNGGGRLEPLLAAYDWLGAAAIMRVGGRYQLGGNETLLEDCTVIASGKLGAPNVTDSGVTFDVDDDRKILKQTLPLRTYNNNGTDAYTQPDRGRSRALLWGTKTGIRPVQYDIHYTGGGAVPLGSYELVDCTDWAPGILGVQTIYWYLDELAAAQRSVDLRAYDQGGDLWISETPTTGRFNVLGDLTPVLITAETNTIYFSTGGGTLVATIAVGPQPRMATTGMSGLNTLFTTAMRAVDGADVTCSYVVASQSFQITKGAGTLSLLCATGADAQVGAWDVLGFLATTDKTGALSYTADYTRISGAGDQIIRCDVVGYVDDASGTYTGTPSAVIQKAPDIAYHILRVFLKVPLSAIDIPSFVAARAVATRPCSLYIGSQRTVGDVFSELETTGDMDLVLKGGVWYCLTRDTSVPAGTPDLSDSDFLAFASRYEPEDLYGTVSLSYNESPDNPEPVKGGRQSQGGAFTDMGEVTDATVVLRHGRPEQRLFKTCLRDQADATTNPARLQEIATQASTKRRRFTFSTKGKALQVAVGGKIRLTRARGLDTTGALASVLVRVLSKRDDWARWVSDIEAIEVV